MAVHDPGDRAFTGAYQAAGGWIDNTELYPETRSVFRPNLAALYGLNSLYFYFHLVPESLQLGVESVLQADGSLNPGRAGLWNVKYLVAAFPRRPDSTDCLGGGPAVCAKVLPNPAFLPRERLVAQGIPVPPGERSGLTALQKTRAPGVDLSQQVWLEVKSLDGAWTKSTPSTGSIQVLKRSSTEIRYHIESETATHLVVSDALYPGWEAERNGETVPMIRANGVGRAIQIPPGEHAIVLRYTPSFRTLGWGLALAGLLLLGFLFRMKQPQRVSLL